MTLLEVKNLETTFHIPEGELRAVSGVSFTIDREETVGLVGESGCGKSVTGLSILGLVKFAGGVIAQGEILFRGEDLLRLDERHLSEIRGGKISMIFQEPVSSLNPSLAIATQICEVLTLHKGLGKKDSFGEARRLLAAVGIPRPELIIRSFPHQLSGGMCQRVMIAMALAGEPELLIADEPTTALDVTIQAEILDLLSSIQKERKTAILLITHDLSLVAQRVARVLVMYAGRVVEEAPTEEIFRRPLHPYTRALLAAIPPVKVKEKRRLAGIAGVVPNPLALPRGCKFHPRCPLSDEDCRREEPELAKISPGRAVRCFKADE